MVKYLIVTLFFFASFAQGQGLFRPVQYQQLQAIINPAASGIEDFVDLKGGYITTGSGFGDQPSSAFIYGNTAFKINIGNKYKHRGIRLIDPDGYHSIETPTEFQYRKQHRHGLSASVIQDKFGAYSNLIGQVSYSYHLPITQGIIWSVGTGLGAVQAKIDPAGIMVADPTIDNTYQAFLNSANNRLTMTLDVGTMLYHSNWWFGYTATDVTKVNLINDVSENYEQKIGHTAMYGMVIRKELAYTIKWGALATYVPNEPLVIGTNVRARYQEKIWGGVSYLYKESANVSFGLFLLDNVSMNYNFRLPLNNVVKINATAHEIMLGIRLNNQNYSRAYMW